MRANSAIRYLAGAGRGAMVIGVSEDGKIDLLPKLKRRMRRETVQRAVDRLRARSVEGEELEAFDRANRTVMAIEFYLNQDQCDQVNAARDAVQGASGRPNTCVASSSRSRPTRPWTTPTS